MLHWFRCDNLYSFRDDKFKTISDGSEENGDSSNRSDGNVIQMKARNDSEINSSIIPLTRGQEKIWQVASLYGANASGKSNFIKALGSMFYNIAENRSDLKGERFIYDYNLKDSVVFCEICFSLEDLEDVDSKTKGYTEYVYGYELITDEAGKANMISDEWLGSRKLGSEDKFKIIFNRTKNENETSKWFPGNDSADFSANKRLIDEFLEHVPENDRSKTPILRLAGKVTPDTKPFYSIHAWFRKVRPAEYFMEEEQRWQITSTAERILKDAEFKKSLLNFLQKFDKEGNISDIDVDTKNEKYDLLVQREIQNFPKNDTEMENDDFRFLWKSIKKESYGTQKIAGLFRFFHDALLNGGLLIIDEFDTKLHPLVIRDLITMLHDHKKNTKAQLIFSAHSLSSLDSKYMHMDEVYFVTKLDKKSSVLRLDKKCFTKKELLAFKDSIKKLEDAGDTINAEDINKNHEKETNEYVDIYKRYASFAELYLDHNRFGAIPQEVLTIRLSERNEHNGQDT